MDEGAGEDVAALQGLTSVESLHISLVCLSLLARKDIEVLENEGWRGSGSSFG